MTVLDFLRASGRLVGALHPGQEGSADENNVALEALNAMLDSWNTQRLAIFHIRRDEYDLVAGTQDYTIGPGGDFDFERPVKIERANLIWSSGGDADHRPLSIITVYDWADIRLPDLTSTIPEQLYYERSTPLGHLRFYPKPDTSAAVEIYTWAKLGRFTALDEVAEFPEGYEEAIKYNLAMRLAMEFRTDIPQFVATTALKSFGYVKRLNKVTPVLQFDYGVGQPYDIRVNE